MALGEQHFSGLDITSLGTLIATDAMRVRHLLCVRIARIEHVLSLLAIVAQLVPDGAWTKAFVEEPKRPAARRSS